MSALISVVMTVYNGQEFLFDSITSILDQSFDNFEFLIVNDGSKDNSDQIIRSFADPRIKYFSFKENTGVINRLNFAIENSKGRYIVKMDQDDISFKDRLLSQFNFMENNLHVGVCGTYVKLFGGKEGIWKMPTRDAEIKASLINGCPFCHPSVILRKSVLVENNIKYSYGYNLTDDYDLWIQLAEVTSFANIALPLLHYRISENQVSHLRKSEQQEQILFLRKRILANFIDISDSQFRSIFHNVPIKTNLKKSEIDSILNIIAKLSHSNLLKGHYTKSSFDKQLGYNLLSVLCRNDKIWMTHVFWAYKNGFFWGLTFRMTLGLINKICWRHG
jgi:glycosyltransferase involved in cell wall biosynthesis